MPDKQCKGCGASKSLEAFYRHPKTWDGRGTKCKECVKAAVRSNYRRKREQYREYERGRVNLPHRVAARNAYAKTKRGREAASRAARVQIEKAPEKRAARIAIGNAIRDGKLTKQPCEVCGTMKNIHAHHDDYSKPLEVRWLCAAHHRQWHRDNG